MKRPEINNNKKTASDEPKTSEILGQEEEFVNGEKIIVIRTTASKLQQAEERLLEIQNLNEVPESLATLSTIACAFQFIQATMLFILASQEKTKWNYYTNYPNPAGFSEPQPVKIGSFSILYYSPIFIFSSGCEHLCCIVFKETYFWFIARNQNPFRWTEYTFSASFMRVLIAQLVGVTDVHLIFAIFLVSALMIHLGCIFEGTNAKARADGLPKQWRSFWASWVAELLSWIVIFTYYAKTVEKSAVDGFVTAIVIILFLLNQTFGTLFTLQWMEIGPFKDYVLGEKGFICLSFTAKSLLAWICLAGVFNQY